ncbi:MAG: tetratricopeptide repeat protein [Acidobacteriota bacterium]
MGRSWIVVVLVVALLGGLSIAVWTAIGREREYQQLVERGDAALSTDQTDAAIEAFSGALALKSESMIAYLKRGEAYRRRGDLGNALKDLRNAARIDPAADRPAELLGDVNYSLERYAKAVESYRLFVALDDRNPRVLYKLGLAQFRAGDVAGAVAALRQTVALDEKLAEAHYLLGLCLKAQNQPGDALKALERASRLSPGLVAPREALAEIYEALSRPRDAITQLEAIATLEPDRPERQAAVARAYARTGRTDAAIEVLGRAAERYPDNAVIYLTLGAVWLDAAEPKRDRVALRKATEALEPLTRGPRISGDALALYGKALMLSGDLAGAAAALQQAADLLPTSPATLLLLADTSERLGRLPAVRAALERWAALTPESGQTRSAVLERLGDLCQKMGDPREAIRAWHRAAEIAPSPVLVVRLATAEIKNGDLRAAAATIDRGLIQTPRSQALLDLRRQLQ